MTQREIYKQLHLEMTMRIQFRGLYPSSTMTPENASRQAHLFAVAQTWYWFNNQDKFVKLCIYLKKETK